MMPEPYQERLATSNTMSPEWVEQLIARTRAKQIKLMRLAEDEIERRGMDDLNPSSRT